MDSKISMATGYAVLAAILVFSFYGLGQSLATGGTGNDEHDLNHEYRERYGDNDRRVAMETYPAYREECGSCHMAYPAMLLPPGSWRKILSGLEDHFGENAELDDLTRLEIEEYLLRESNRVSYRKLFRNLGTAEPLRITELPYFVHEHDEIPPQLLAGNEQVQTLSRCNACHRDAERGRFDEDDVVIPGFARWDD